MRESSMAAHEAAYHQLHRAPWALNFFRTNIRSSKGGDIAMNNSARILITAVLALVASPTVSNAQVRDATSKILGNYDRFDRPAQARSAPAYSLPQSVVTRQGGEQPARIAQQPAGRAYSYDPGNQAPPCAASQAAPATQATRQPTQPQAVRRFSYEPGYVAPRSRFAPSRGWQSGVRDAGSKVRGDY
jgi:hypothetical protein